MARKVVGIQREPGSKLVILMSQEAKGPTEEGKTEQTMTQL
jgi:hypothetical protein